MKRLVCLLALLIAVSAQIEAVRLSTVPGGMTVGWTTSTPYPSAPKLAWGYTPALGQVSVGDFTHYNTGKFFNYVVLINLTASSTVYYQIDAEPVSTFSTAPPTGSLNAYPLTMMQVGDLGIDFSEQTISLMEKLLIDVDFTLHSGM